MVRSSENLDSTSVNLITSSKKVRDLICEGADEYQFRLGIIGYGESIPDGELYHFIYGVRKDALILHLDRIEPFLSSKDDYEVFDRNSDKTIRTRENGKVEIF